MSDTTHTCCLCGFKWESIDVVTGKKVETAASIARKIRVAAKVNRSGPYCSLCHHLEMAERHAIARGYGSLTAAVEDWHARQLAKPK